MEEVKGVVWKSDGFKSLGPNEYNLNFFKMSWEVIKENIIRAVRSFYYYGLWPKGINASFITLISKSITHKILKNTS